MEQNILKALEEISVQYFKNMFGIDIGVIAGESYKQSPRPDFVSEVYGYIGLAGDNHQGQIILGFSKDFPQKLVSKFLKDVPDEEKEEFAKSAVCEMLNNLGGILARHSVIKENYSEISQTLPVLNDTTNQGSVYFMKSDGGTLKFKCMDTSFYMYMSLKRFTSNQVRMDNNNFSSDT